MPVNGNDFHGMKKIGNGKTFPDLLPEKKKKD